MSILCQAKRVPRGDKRRDEIAAVAEDVFLERGYAETTMQIIAARAGSSKETLYRHFGSKEAMFSEVVRRRSLRITGGEESELSGRPEKVLLDLALNLLRFLNSADSLCLYRVVVAEAPREPDLGRIFYAQGPGRVLNRITGYLEAATKRGELRCADADLAARLFLGAVIAHHQCLSLVGGAVFSDTQRSSHAKEAVALFMARYGV
ncbi:Transcriptional regulator, TetR family [Methylocella tundrae]|uniref:Transcriptional regulator, TetR family n=1 Tax=Methylocella tundrae TaxID=227605 RepID=A0A4U8Z2N5_METTU|nr:TetR/AcrR family transcriptional regulator [Methylocella tundrae]VFU09656.1 Transcriptional regulator, TetR family [Methylocella tundrae]